MAVSWTDADGHPNLHTVKELVSRESFEERNGPSEKYQRGQAARSVSGKAARFLTYAKRFTAESIKKDPEAAAHLLGGALSQLPVAEMAEVSNLLGENCAREGSLLAAISKVPALACLPAPLLALSIPGETRVGLSRHSVKFGDYVAGVTRLGHGANRRADDSLGNLGIVVIGEASPGYPNYERNFLEGMGKYAGSGMAPASYVLANGSVSSGAYLTPIRNFLLAQRSFGTRAGRLVVAVRADMQFTQRFKSLISPRYEEGGRTHPDRAWEVALEHGPAELSLALSLHPDVFAVKTAPGWQTPYETRAVLELFGKPVTKYWYPGELSVNAGDALERAAKESGEGAQRNRPQAAGRIASARPYERRPQARRS